MFLVVFLIVVFICSWKFMGVISAPFLKKSLKGSVVLITGASSGLGKSCCFEFSRRGCKVILCSRNVEELEKVKAALEAEENNTVLHQVFPLDVSDFDGVDSTIKQILASNNVDILINNAGISSRGNVVSTELGVFEQVMSINYLGQISVTKSLLPHMIKRRKGHIVGIGSVQGKIGIPDRGPYGASKHAMQSFYDCLRAEVACHEINVTNINPSYIKTNVSRNALTGDGSMFAKSDEKTEKGYSPDYVAKVIANAVVENKKEVLIAPLLHRVAIWLRFLSPDLYFWVMEKRAKKPS